MIAGRSVPPFRDWGPLELRCPLCRFFSRVRFQLPGDSDNDDVGFKLYRIRITSAFVGVREPAKRNWPFPSERSARSVGFESRSAMLFVRLVRPRRPEQVSRKKLSDFQWLPHTIFDCEPSLIHGRFMPDSGVDLDAVRRWIDHCSRKHEYCRQPEVDVPGFRVIRCSDRTVCPLPEFAKYVAVSYVWGGVQVAPPSNGRLGPIGTLPRVIGDSLVVATDLGYDFL